MRLRWARYFPSFFIVAMYLLLFNAFIVKENEVMVWILRGFILTLFILELIYYAMYTNSPFAKSNFNKVGLITIPIIGITVALLFLALVTALSRTKKSKVTSMNPAIINYNVTNYDGGNKSNQIQINFVSIDENSKEMKLKVTEIKNTIIQTDDYYTYNEVNSGLVTNTLVGVYYDDVLIEKEVVNGEIRYYNRSLNTPNIRFEYETTVKYSEIEDYKFFVIRTYGKHTYLTINDTNYSYKKVFINTGYQNTYAIYSSNMPDKYFMYNYEFWEAFDIALYSIFAILLSIVAIKIFGFIYYKVKHVE